MKVIYSWILKEILAKEGFLSMTLKSEIIKKYIPRYDCENIYFLHIKQLYANHQQTKEYGYIHSWIPLNYKKMK